MATPLAALVVAFPAALRLAGEPNGFFESLFAVAGLLCPLVALGIVIARGARRSIETLAPLSGVPLFVGLSLFAMASLPATAILGAILKANTHHRALGGATFATFALVADAATAVVAWRVTALVLPRFRRPAARTGLALVLGLLALLLVFITVSAGAASHEIQPEVASAPQLPALLVDGALGLAAVIAAGLFDVPHTQPSWTSWIGAGALLGLVAAGVVLVTRSPSLAHRFGDQAPLAAVVGEVIGVTPGP